MFGNHNCGILKHPGFNDLGKLLGGNDPPPAPNYAKAAEKTAQGNRVNQVTPYGSLTYSRGGDWNQEGYRKAVASGGQGSRELKERFGYDPNQWTATTTLSPAQQQLLDQQNKTSLGLGQSIDRGLDYVTDSMSKPLNTSGMTQIDPATVGGSEKIYAALLERMQPQLDRMRQSNEEELLMQGHNRGGEAWNATADDLNRGENDARLGALLQAGQEQSRLHGLQTTSRQNELAELLTMRNDPLNTLNALRTGAQVTNPTFQNTPNGPDYSTAAGQQYDAALGGYNAQQAGANNTMSGLFSLGSSMLTGGIPLPWMRK